MGAVELLINVGMTVSIACAVLATLWSLVDYIVRFKKDINVEE
ncbi:unknown [Clostridium sp. CAG:921]|nr:unknown [Clostridium sp. CAG:921]